MKNWFSRNWHWVFFLLLSGGFVAGLTDLTSETPAVVAAVFGGVGVISMGILLYYIEKQKRQTGN